MRHCLFPLLAAMTLTASIARAELEYVAYDLDAKSGTVLSEAPADIHEDTWHSPTKILFVRDPSVSTHYIGVFELTKGQAEILGFKDPAADTKPLEQAFAQQASSAVTWTIPAEHPLLRFPTVSEWQAYADVESQERPCNMRNGRRLGLSYVEPSEWWKEGDTLGKSAKVNKYGVVDMFGNVAEYTMDKGEFYGGWASGNSAAGNFSTSELPMVKNTGKSPQEIAKDTTIGNGRLGIRLVYMPPAEVRYTAKVMLGGKVVGEPELFKVDETVTLDWPQPTAGHRRITRTVTPQELTFLFDEGNISLFKMPASDVTLAFEEKAIATVSVTAEGEGGTVAFARKEPLESFDTLPENEAYVGETLTLTATPEASWKVKEWRDAEGAPIADAGTKTTWDYAIPEGTKAGTPLAFTVVFERPEYEVNVTLDGVSVEGWPKRFAEGELVSVEPPMPTKPGYRLFSGPKELKPFTFNMPAESQTFAYTSKAYVSLVAQAEGQGTATAAASGAFIGDEVRFSATPSGRWAFKEWRNGERVVSSDASFVYSVPDDVTLAGQTITLTAVFDPPPKHTARVMLGGKERWSGTFEEGATFVYPAPTPDSGYRLVSFPEGGDATGGTATMGTADMTLTYAQKAYVNVVVQGRGSVSNASPFVGERITLEAKAPKYRVFKQWTGATISTENSFTYTIPTGSEPGSTLTFMAEYDLLPRVLVTGGSARVTQGTPHGEGYYSIDALLTLTAETAPKGYKFSKWVSSGEGGVLAGNTFTVNEALRNRTVTLTAEYIVDNTQPSENPAVTHIGVDAEGSGAQTAVTLGWEADTPTTHKLLGNTFVFHPTKTPEPDYAVLDLTDKTTTYAATVENNADNKTRYLPLKRIRPTSGTWYASGDTYYVGIYETTVGHFKTLGVKMGNISSVNVGETSPYVFKEPESPDAFNQALSTAFGIKATRPSYAQIANITKVNLKADKDYKGSGYQKDAGITTGMIVSEGDSVSTAVQSVGSKTVDPYGFYDLWGNALEWLSDNTGHGGRVGYSGGITANPSKYNLDSTDTGWSSTGTRGAVRPAVVVPEKVKVWIKDGLSGEKIGPFEVLPGQVVRLAKQVRTGYDFAGWKASAGALTEESGQWVSSGITKEVTFTATYKEKNPLILSYEGCTGPDTALPGQTITVYAKSPTGAPMTTLEIAPDGSGTCETKGTEGTVTFSATATGDPLIKATYTAVSETLSVTYSGCEGPATVKPGEAVKIPLGPRADGGTLTSVTVAPAYAASVNLATGTVTFTDDFTGLTTATVTATYAVPKAMVSWIGWAGPTTASPGERVTVPLTLEGRRLVKLTADKGVANTWVGPDDAGVEFAGNLSGIGVITITAEYEAPKSGYRLRLR